MFQCSKLYNFNRSWEPGKNIKNKDILRDVPFEEEKIQNASQQVFPDPATGSSCVLRRTEPSPSSEGLEFPRHNKDNVMCVFYPNTRL